MSQDGTREALIDELFEADSLDMALLASVKLDIAAR